MASSETLSPPTNNTNLVEPDLANKKRQAHFTAAPVDVELDRGPTEDRKQSVCWNCGGNDHTFKKYNKAKSIFCSKCGRQDVISPKKARQ